MSLVLREKAIIQSILSGDFKIYQCAICGLNIRIGDSIVGLDAAHIKWHQAGGPDIEENGLCLCSLHHKLFDRGTFSISNDMKIYISNLVYGVVGFDDWLKDFHGKFLIKPQHPKYYPNPEYLYWHKKNVFKGEPRYVQSKKGESVIHT